MKIKILVIVFVSSFWSNGFCLEELQLPFEGGYTLYVTRGYNKDSHKDYNFYDGDDRYALDFVSSGCESWDKPILAVASGTVLEAHDIDDNGYGKYVIIDHGGGYHSRYAHLNSVTVSNGNPVVQGQKIGKMGNTGNVFGNSCRTHQGMHLHFALYFNGDAYKPEPISGYFNLTTWKLYTSLNTYNPMTNFHVGKYVNDYVFDDTCDARPYSRPFAVTYYHNKGADMLGYPISEVYKMEYCAGCYGYGAAKVYVQDFEGGLCGSATLVMNMLTFNIRFNYLGVVYPIHGQIRNYWYQHFWELGAPVSNEYLWDYGGEEYTVQWFEPSQNYYVAVVYDASDQKCTRYDTSDIFCPPLDANFLNQQVWETLGCPDGICGTGGGSEPTLYPPTNLALSVINTNMINLTWSRGLNPIEYTNLRFKIYRGDSSQTLEYFTTTADASYSDMGLSPDTQYCYAVSAYIGASESEKGESICASTYPLPPTADFAANPTAGTSPLTVNFTNTSSGQITNYNWNLGNGQSSTLVNPVQTYVNAGTYQIILMAIGPGGSSIKTISIIVTASSPEKDTTAPAVPDGLNATVIKK